MSTITVTNINVIHLSNGDKINTALPYDVIVAMTDVCERLVRVHRKITAIKLVREAFDCGLREAKCFAEDAAE